MAMNHNRPAFQRQRVWELHDQYLTPRQRQPLQSTRGRVRSKPNRLVTALERYQGRDEELLEYQLKVLAGRQLSEREKGRASWLLFRGVPSQ